MSEAASIRSCSILSSGCPPMRGCRPVTPPRLLRCWWLSARYGHARGPCSLFMHCLSSSAEWCWWHYPSDVLAGALVGIIGAVLVRRYFAWRHLGFTIRTGWPRSSISGTIFEAHEDGCPRASGPIRHPAMTSMDPAVSVVVPVRNEAGNIAPLVTEIAKALNGQWPFEIIYVDDGSSDATGAELQQLMAQHAWLRRVRHKQSCGQSAAVRTGVGAARAPSW